MSHRAQRELKKFEEMLRKSVQVSSVQDGIYVLGKAHNYALTASLRSFPNVANGSNVHLIEDGPLSSFQERSYSASFFHAYLLQTIDGMMSLASCPKPNDGKCENELALNENNHE